MLNICLCVCGGGGACACACACARARARACACHPLYKEKQLYIYEHFSLDRTCVFY